MFLQVDAMSRILGSSTKLNLNEQPSLRRKYLGQRKTSLCMIITKRFKESLSSMSFRTSAPMDHLMGLCNNCGKLNTILTSHGHRPLLSLCLSTSGKWNQPLQLTVRRRSRKECHSSKHYKWSTHIECQILLCLNRRFCTSMTQLPPTSWAHTRWCSTLWCRDMISSSPTASTLIWY